MSSFLGRAGANLRQVIGYASQQPCVLLLDVSDAIAKRRDDNSDIRKFAEAIGKILWVADTAGISRIRKYPEAFLTGASRDSDNA